MFKLSNFSLQKLDISYGIGLDISDSILRLVRLKKIGDKINLEDCESVNVPNGYIVQGEIKEIDKVVSLILDLTKKINPNLSPIEAVISLPETKTFLKMIRIANASNVSKEKSTDSVKDETILQYLPFTPEDIYIDYQIIAYELEYTGWLVAGCPRPIVDSYIKLAKVANILPLALEVEALAILESVMDKVQDSSSAILVIDLGTTRTGMILYDYSSVQFTVSVSVSGLALTKKISAELGIGYEEAEEVKLVCGFDSLKCQGILRTIMLDNATELIDNIKRTIYFYQKHFLHGRAVGKIILTGGGASCLNLSNIIKDSLNIEVVLANPMLHIDGINKNIKFSTKTDIALLSFTTAIGLAFIGLDKA